MPDEKPDTMTDVGHITSYAYPNNIQAQEALPVALAKFRGEEVETNDLVHAGYTGAGFILSIFFPHQPLVGGQPTIKDLANMPEARELALAAAAAIPWEILWPVFLELFKKWLNRT